MVSPLLSVETVELQEIQNICPHMRNMTMISTQVVTLFTLVENRNKSYQTSPSSAQVAYLTIIIISASSKCINSIYQIMKHKT